MEASINTGLKSINSKSSKQLFYKFYKKNCKRERENEAGGGRRCRRDVDDVGDDVTAATSRRVIRKHCS